MKFFKQYFKLSKIEQINYILKIIISFIGILLTAFHFFDPVTWHKLPSYLVTIILPFMPELFAKFGLKTTIKLQLIYDGFLIIAMILGIDLDWYKTIIIMGHPSYDKIVHTLSGVFTAFGGKEILDLFYDGKERISQGDKKANSKKKESNKHLDHKTGSPSKVSSISSSPFSSRSIGKPSIKRKLYSSGFAFLFILCFVVFTATMWECYEFSYDKLFGGHMQELNAPGVDDTMGDIISASLAGFITAIFLRKNK